MDRHIPSNDPNAATTSFGRPLNEYQTTVRSLSDRLAAMTRPIRILDAVRWDDQVEEAFFAANGRELPRVDREYYGNRRLSFDPDRKREDFRDLERDVRSRLGDDSPAGRLIGRRCQEGRAVVDLVAWRGTPEFAAQSVRLYGSAAEKSSHDGRPLAHLGRALAGLMEGRAGEAPSGEQRRFSAAEAVSELSLRLKTFFKDTGDLHVRLSDGIIADATAGVNYIKVRDDAHFTERELRLLEVHEGWVHLGTTLNGQAQPICTFLTRCTPSATVTQEGLAVLTELLACASHPARVRRLTHRIEAVSRAEAGANFLEVYRFYLEQGYEPRESYQHTTRVFRGSLPDRCGPFTKDLSYGKGFLLVSDFVRTAVRTGSARLVPLLFCGKTSLAEVSDLAQLVDEGLIRLPRHLPPSFADAGSLAARLGVAA